MSKNSADERLTGKPKRVVYRLQDFEVEEVSLVDRGANRRKFLIRKHEEAEMLVDKIAMTKTTRVLTEALERTASLVNKLKDKEGHEEFQEAVAEASDIGTLIAGLKEAYPSPTSKADEDLAAEVQDELETKKAKRRTQLEEEMKAQPEMTEEAKKAKREELEAAMKAKPEMLDEEEEDEKEDEKEEDKCTKAEEVPSKVEDTKEETPKEEAEKVDMNVSDKGGGKSLTLATEALEKLTSILSSLKDIKVGEGGKFQQLLNDALKVGTSLMGLKDTYPVPTTKTEAVTEPVVATPDSFVLSTAIEAIGQNLKELAEGEPTKDAVEGVAKRMDDLFMRGGFTVDTGDMEMLGKIIEVMSGALDESKVEKRAGKLSKVLVEIAERALSLGNKIKAMDAPTKKEIKELKAIQALLLGLASKYPSPQAKTEGAVVAPAIEPEKKEEVQAPVVDLMSQIEAKLAAAIAPLQKHIEALTTVNQELKTELTKRDSQPVQDRGSTPEPTTHNQATESLFPMDYND